MTTNPMMHKNPFMSAWLSATNSYLNAGRGLWMAEMHRQQTAMMTEFSKQMTRFWTGAWMTQPAPRPASPELGMAALGAAIAEAGAASRQRDSSTKAAAQLRTLVERRTAGPAKRAAGPAKRKTRAVR